MYAGTMTPNRLRTYDRSTSVVFLKTKEAFGGLSNMAGGFPLKVNGVRLQTSEALYQACRFPHLPDIQQLIIAQTSPMTAKMKGKPHRSNSRPDWDAVRVKIMRWCLRVKLVQNYSTFSQLLLETGDRPIVEESRKDDFWGAKALAPYQLVGRNALGRLLMELREEVRVRKEWPRAEVAPLDLPDFLLFGRPIEPVSGSSAPGSLFTLPPSPKPTQSDAELRPPEALKDHVRPMPTSPAPRKKLIEVSIPLEAINKASAREKSIRHGHPSTLHLWWARRPLAACRAVLFAQLVDDPSAWPERFPTELNQQLERRRLHKVIADLVPWEASNDERILNAARWEIARSVAWGLGEEPPPQGDGKAILDYLQTKAPPVYDPFSGGGSIPLEAQRLGLRAYGSDLNPVAVLIGKALVEIPPKFAGLPPVNPKSQAEFSRGGRWSGKGAQGLAEDVRYYGQWMRDEAEKRIGHLYPKAELPDGSDATVIAWLWARTVRSPDPAAKGAMVPLVSSFLLSTKEDKKAWVEVVIDPASPDGWRFEVHAGALLKADEERLKGGTKTGRGSNFACVLTGSAIDGDHVKSEGMAGRLGTRLLAIVAEGHRSRVYLSPIAAHEALAATARPTWEPEGDLPHDPRNFWTVQYGLGTFASLFTPRQLVALTTFSDLVSEARENMLTDARAAGLPSTPRLAEGGIGAEAYADAVGTYLALIVSRLADRSSALCSWDLRDGQGRKPGIRNVFSRQAIAMTWDFSEAFPLSEIASSLGSSIGRIADVLDRSLESYRSAISLINASKNSFPVRPVVISTDPPYYDNIGYADLSDFFYIWLRRSLSSIWPDLFRRLTTPKADELVATPYRHGGRDAAETFFMKGMGEALTAMRKAATDGEPLAIYYAFKQSEVAQDGITSAGWASFLQAVVDSGLVVDGTWPVRTELANRMIGRDTNALASSIVLVCRKRAPTAPVITRTDFVRALRKELPDAIDNIRRAGVGPVDMQQSVIGPGMGVFSRHAKVLEDDDSAMSVKTALSLINRVWEEIDQEVEAAFDPETQVALTWFTTYGFDARPSGELITLANAKNIGMNALFASGVFKDLKGKTALMPRQELPKDWSPGKDGSLTVWECVQHTARVLIAEDGGAAAAGRLIAAMGRKAADARTLAYRLFEIATQKGWAQEALVYNELAQEWPNLEDKARDPRVVAAVGPAQHVLL
jgi:putative DNA methylase